jgi:hypothetical protein
MTISIREYKGVDFGHAHYVLRKHYDLGRPLTTDEVKAEIDNLIRKHNAMSLDYVGEHLHASIFRKGKRQ